jgi:hypothetical protein
VSTGEGGETEKGSTVPRERGGMLMGEMRRSEVR